MNRRLTFVSVLGLCIALTVIFPLFAITFPTALQTVHNVATLRGGNFGASPYVELNGYYAEGDGGGGKLRIDLTDTTTADNGVTVFVDAVGHRFKRAAGKPISVLEGGAKCDGTTDDTARINATVAATSALNSSNAVVTFPLTPCKTTDGILAASNLTIEGPGKGIGGIREADATAANSAFYGNGFSNLTIKGLTIYGSWLTTQDDTGQRCTYFTNAYNVTIEDSECGYTRSMGLTVNGGSRIFFINNYVHHIARDGINCEDCDSGGASGNTLIHGGDDAIAWHVSPSASAPVRGLVNINNNLAEDFFGYKALGLKAGGIRDNTCRLCKGYGIYVTFDSGYGEGYTSMLGIAITGNVITDVINPTVYGSSSNINACIDIGSFSQAGSGTLPFTSTGSGIQAPWPYDWNPTNGSSTVTVTPGFANLVAHNVCTRSLPDGVTYASYGFNPSKESTNVGYMFTTAGWVNPTVSTGALNGTGILVHGDLRHTLFDANVLFDGNYGIFFTAQGKLPLFVDDVAIRNNLISFATGDGIGSDLTSALAMDLTIEDNSIDCDPLANAPYRNADGSWQSQAFPGAIDVTWMQGVTVGGNRIRNCLYSTRTANANVAFSRPNIIYAAPVATGYNAGNKGVGVIPTGQHYVIINGDPTSANFDQIANDDYTEADLSGGCPSTGTWVKGVFVKNTNPSIAAGKVLLGCSRLTTGAGNVANTDWAPVYGTNS